MLDPLADEHAVERIVMQARQAPHAQNRVHLERELVTPIRSITLEDYWAFTVDDDLRVLFRWEGDEAFLVNLGSHGQVC